jgi:beta-phosphoglucomutase-like phosphatase (HAD superfamily)
VSAPAVVFDLDGVLVDSHPALKAAYARFLARHGKTGSETEFARIDGPSLDEIVRILKAAHGLPGDGARLRADYAEEIARAHAAAPLRDGMGGLVARLFRAGFRLAVASAATSAQVRAVLDRHGLGARFEVLVGGDLVARGKPAPDLHRLVFKRMGSPAAVLAVEDSDAGVAGATAAGLPVVQATEAPAIEQAIFERLLDCGLEARDVPLRVVVEGGWTPPPPALTAEVERRWRAATAAHAHLHDSAVLCCTGREVDARRAVVHATAVPYRFVHASVEDPALDLALEPMGVSGRVVDESGRTLLGRRRAVTEYPGHWELVPSGSVDATRPDGGADATALLLDELREETGLPPAGFGTRPLGLVTDRAHGVLDLCYELTPPPGAGIEAARATGEHDVLRVVPVRDAGPALAGEPLIPTSRLLLVLPP